MNIWLVKYGETLPVQVGARKMRTWLMAERFANRGHKVIWWSSTFSHQLKRFVVHGEDEFKVSENFKLNLLATGSYKKNLSWGRHTFHKRLANSFAKKCHEMDPPDAIIVSLPTLELALEAVNYGKMRNIPVIVDIRDLWPDVFETVVPKFAHWLLKYITGPMKKKLAEVCENATAIFGITEEYLKWGLSKSNRQRTKDDGCFPLAYVRHLHNKNEIEKAVKYWKTLGVVEDKQMVRAIYVGSFTHTSDFKTIIKTAEILSKKQAKIQFVFCGSGPMINLIKGACSRLNNCIFGGWVDAAQINTLLTLSDVGIVPYVDTPNFVNNIPNKPPEYMSEGLVIANSLSHGKLHEMLAEEGGGFSYNNNPDLLAEKLQLMGEDKQVLVEMKINSKELFKKSFDGNEHYDRLVSHVEDIIGRY